MRFTLNIPCLWRLGFNPRFDGYACQVVVPLFIFLAVCGFISMHMHNQTSSARETNDVGTSNAFPKAPEITPKTAVHMKTDTSDPNLHYGVVMDLGSSGSRVYVYYWPPHTGLPGQLLSIQPVRDQNSKPVIKKIEPGISAFVDKPAESAEYLKPLLEYVAGYIPESKHRETPLYILATAGMRMLSERDQDILLADLRADIPRWCNFLFTQTHVEVISGKQEAIYSWVAINFALGRFDHAGGVLDEDHLSLVELPGPEPTTHVRKQTVGILDMGGGSLQVAFEVPHSEDAAKGSVLEFGLGCTKHDIDHVYRLYVTTFLNFGSNSVRKLYENHLINSVTGNTTTSSINDTKLGSSTVMDPCMPVDFREEISAADQTYTIQGTGNFHECKTQLRPFLNQSAPCIKQPCSINGMYQPEIDFDHSEFYGFAEFYYTMEDLLGIGGKYSYRKFQGMAREFCSRKWDELLGWHQNNRYSRADYSRYRLQCFKSAWMSLVLHDGLGFPSTYKHLTSLQYINNEEIHWTLGALLYKTKYYPLRELNKQEMHRYKPPWVLANLNHANYLIVICFVIVVAAILIYIRHLRRWQHPQIRKIPTMSYFMTEEGQSLDGLRTVDGYKSPESYYQYS